MTQVSFYTLGSIETEVRLQFVCRLTEKARSMGHEVFIHAESMEQARLLDDMLWQFKATSFIPHDVVPAGSAGEAAVAIGTDVPVTRNDMLINLADGPCESHQQFSRIDEILTGDAESLARGRSCYRFYQALGYQLETHKL